MRHRSILLAMPELPEVETARRTMERVLVGKKIKAVEVPPDEIVLSGFPPEAFEKTLLGAKVKGVGRKGKYWWLEIDRAPTLIGHLGMAGWIREIGAPSIRLREHGEAPFDDADGRPRFLKLMIQAADGGRIVFTDGRRLGRLWLGDPASDPRLAELGPDMYNSLPSAADLQKALAKRKAPIKALLLDQSLFAGVGNWIADEVLYQSKIAPKREGSSLSLKELESLRRSIKSVLAKAVELGADSDQYPKTWLFHHRWIDKRSADTIGGKAIVRETVGSRTTAWVPEIQK